MSHRFWNFVYLTGVLFGVSLPGLINAQTQLKTGATLSFAERLAEIEKRQATLSGELDTLGGENGDSGTFASTQKEITSLRDQISEARKGCVETVKKVWWKKATTECVPPPGAQAQIDAAEKSLAEKRQSLIAIDARRGEIKKLLGSVAADRVTLDKDKKAADAAFSLYVSQSSLDWKFDKLRNKHYDLDRVLNTVEKEYDTWAVGAYLSDKISSLLQDDKTFCKATAWCGDKSKPKVSGQDVQESLFPTAKGVYRSAPGAGAANP